MMRFTLRLYLNKVQFLGVYLILNVILQTNKSASLNKRLKVRGMSDIGFFKKFGLFDGDKFWFVPLIFPRKTMEIVFQF